MRGTTPEAKEIDGIMHKRCTTCKEFKTLDNFYKNHRYFLGCQHWCKQCGSKYFKERNTPEKNRETTLNKWGLTSESYNELLDKQEGKCAICFEIFEILVVDHDHKTNQIRGLLCDSCNKGLGHFKDNPMHLTSALDYLMRNSCHGLQI